MCNTIFWTVNIISKYYPWKNNVKNISPGLENYSNREDYYYEKNNVTINYYNNICTKQNVNMLELSSIHRWSILIHTGFCKRI